MPLLPIHIINLTYEDSPYVYKLTNVYSNPRV